ncbi:MAG TPA: hypothetical protein VGJ59_13115 [Jatrophihabitantaceae bacterium]
MGQDQRCSAEHFGAVAENARGDMHGTGRMLREAEKVRTNLLGEADAFKSARTSASVGYLLDRSGGAASSSAAMGRPTVAVRAAVPLI